MATKSFGVIYVVLLIFAGGMSSVSHAAIPAEERSALIALYNSTNGDAWTDNSGWKEPPLDSDDFAMPGTENNWHGVTTDAENTTVLNIHPASNQLTGSIPPELGNLANLEYLHLGSNQLTGFIPPELGNLANLVLLYLGSNQLTGSIPPELGNLTNLEYLNLSSNQLTGSIPPELGNLASLYTVGLGSNQLTGSIPINLENLDNLEYLGLESNQLTGSIPPELEKLANLEFLKLGGNQLTGCIPPELGNLASLVSLSLRYNQLTCSIPPELGNLANLVVLNLPSNQLAGSIPPELENLDSLRTLYLQGNQLAGSIPHQLGNLTNLAYLNLSSNQLTGSIPPNLGNLANLVHLGLPSNQLTGSIPPELGNLANLEHLHLSSNQLTGSVPPELGNLGSLVSLYLSSNQLTGSIPTELVNLTNLDWLDLDWNALYTNDPGLFDFINIKNPDFFLTQTVPPTNVTVSQVSTTSVEISWDTIAYTGDEGGYRVFFSTNPQGPYSLFGMTGDKTVDHMEVTELDPGTTYYFVVQTRTEPHSSNQNTVDSEFSGEVVADCETTTINGNIYYDGTHTGEIHIVLVDADHSPVAMTSIPALGPYSLSCPPGTYHQVVAQMDVNESGAFSLPSFQQDEPSGNYKAGCGEDNDIHVGCDPNQGIDIYLSDYKQKAILHDSFEADYFSGHAGDMDYHNGYLWICDETWTDNGPIDIRKVNPSNGQLVELYDLGVHHVTSVEWIGNDMWVCFKDIDDTNLWMIRQYTFDGTVFTEGVSCDLPSSTDWDIVWSINIAWDGNLLWVQEKGPDVNIYKINLSDCSIVETILCDEFGESKHLGLGDISDICFSDGYLWAMNDDSPKFARFNPFDLNLGGTNYTFDPDLYFFEENARYYGMVKTSDLIYFLEIIEMTDTEGNVVSRNHRILTASLDEPEVATCRTWHQTGGLEGVQVIHVIIDPSDPSTLYADTFGSKVYKSEDGGVSWNQKGTTSLPHDSDTYILSMDPSDPDTLYVGTVGGGVFKSTDGGQNWDDINKGLTNLRIHMAPAIDPNNPSTIYVGTEGPVFIFKSTDGGQNWDDIPGPSPSSTGSYEVCALAIDPSNSSTIYAGLYYDAGYHDGGMFKSTNGGQNWFPINNGLPDPTSPESGNNWLTIDPTDTQTIYITTDGGVFKSTNGGQNWFLINNGLTTTSATGLAIHPSNPEIIYVGTWGGGIFWSHDGGTNWHTINTGLTNLNVTGLALDPSNPSTLYAGTYGDGVFKSVSGDFDGDGDVDGSDLTKFSDFYTTDSYPEADLTDDGIINLDDVAQFAQNFGIVP